MRGIPDGDGWRADGFSGGKEDCLAHIDQVWTDMRPLSARNTGAEAAVEAGAEVTVKAAAEAAPEVTGVRQVDPALGG